MRSLPHPTARVPDDEIHEARRMNEHLLLSFVCVLHLQLYRVYLEQTTMQTDDERSKKHD